MKAPAQESGPPRERAIRWRGIAASLVLHLALIAMLIGLWRSDLPPEAPPTLIKVVFGDPGAAGAAGGSGGDTKGIGQDTSAAPTAVAPAAAAPSSPAQAAEAAPAPPSEPMPQTAEASPPVEAPAPSPAPPAPAVAQKPKTAELSAPPPRPAHKPAHRVRPVAAKPQPRPPAKLPPPPSPSPALPAVASADAPTAAAAAPGSGNGAGAKVGQGQGDAGAGRGVFGDGSLDGPGDEYLEKLRRWLARYKRYPQAALDKKEEGKVVVGFTLKRDGTVLDAWIVRSSGIPMLDDAALDMMHRASPVPPVPDRYKGSELKLAMPVDYSIGFFERLFR